MGKRRLPSGFVAVLIYTLLSLVSRGLGVEFDLTVALIQAAIALLAVAVLWRYVLPEPARETERG